MSFAHTLDGVEEINRLKVQYETFGHLSPKKGVKYSGYIFFALSEYGSWCVIKSNFNNLSSNPWYYNDVSEFICEHAKSSDYLYKFTGTYEKFENGEYEFKGKIIKKKLDA